MVNEFKLRQDMVEVGKRMYDKSFVASNDGNISVRISEKEILITPTGVSKGYMRTSDMLKVDMTGRVITGSMKPTSEMKMHLAVYEKRRDVAAIVHAHPPFATAFAVAGIICDKIALPEVIFSLGLISLAEYGTPTTDELPGSIKRHLDNSDAILLSNHGALTVGKDLFDAYYKMETLEHFSRITLYARLLGGEKALAKEQIKDLFDIRENVYGKPMPKITGDEGLCGGADVIDILGEGTEQSKVDDASLKEAVRELVLSELKKLEK